MPPAPPPESPTPAEPGRRPGTGPAPDRPAFAERLWPSTGIWLVTVLFGASMGLVVAPLGTTAAAVAAVVGVAGFTTLLTVTTPRVAVTDEEFTAGRAALPLRFVGAVEPLPAAAMRAARGVRLDARAYLCLRGWLPAGVRVVVDDPDDPTPYWLVSSRRPAALAAALGVAAGRHRPPD